VIPPARIGVVGFGVGGAMAAALLADLGHEVTLLEQAETLASVGAGLLLQPSGQLVLERLGLLERVTANAERIDQVLALTPRGHRLVDLAYGEIGVHGYGVHRSDLFDVLRAEVARRPVRVELGAAIVARKDRTLVDGSGRNHGPFDAVIVADGSASALRSALGLERFCHEYRWGALWVVGRSDAVRHRLHQVVRGTRELIGLLPLGAGRCNVFSSQRLADYDETRRRGFTRWRDGVLALCPAAEEPLAAVSSFDQLALTSYRHAITRRAHDGHAVLVGDAWHAMSPHLGQGVNLALLDAWTLAQAVDAAASFPEAFARYAAARRAQLRYYAFVTALLSPFFQSNGRLKGWARDAGLPLMWRIPPLRRGMTLTMAGLVGRRPGV
jgi:2-polyprenyl-6-methoxyphenol hydroxylase-like FAD-dependent oxidoreductase